MTIRMYSLEMIKQYMWSTFSHLILNSIPYLSIITWFKVTYLKKQYVYFFFLYTNLYHFLNIYCPWVEIVCADITGLCAILQLGIRAYCLPLEHVHFSGPTGLSAVALICVIVQLMKRYHVWPVLLHMCHKYVGTCCQ